MVTVLLLADALVIAALLAGTVYARFVAGGEFLLESYWSQWPVVPIYILVIVGFGGYNLLLSPPQELRAVSLATLLVIGLLSSLIFWTRHLFWHSRAVLIVGGLLLLAVIPLLHFAVKRFFSRFSWWGYPAVFYVFDKKEACAILKLGERLHSSLRPALALRHREDSLEGVSLGDVPVMDGEEFLASPGPKIDGVFIFLGHPQIGSGARTVLRKAERRFTKTIILHEGLHFGNQWVRPVDLGQRLGLEIVQRLLDTRLQIAKRVVDVCLAGLLLLVLSPLLLAIALAVVVASPGPVFYRHARLGRGGRPFGAWKFRTMVRNAEAALEGLLAADPALRSEWEASHKLEKDPRITRVGAFLRRSSLDELPQLFNVLAGDMSLIGPRPIAAPELPKYGELYDLVSRVRPGMTGLWQVSGRSRLSYAERVELDVYYIKNWSFWLDLYIMLKTPFAVLRFEDAL